MVVVVIPAKQLTLSARDLVWPERQPTPAQLRLDKHLSTMSSLLA
jgi:hypothetical protein